MSTGTVMSKSTTEGEPCRLPALIVSVVPTSDASMLPRLPCSACTLTRFCVQVWMTIAPPKLFTDRLAPAGTAIVVSVSPCIGASVARTAAAMVVNMSVYLSLGLCRGDRVDPPQQLQLAPHCVGEVEIQVRVSRIRGERRTCLCDR